MRLIEQPEQLRKTCDALRLEGRCIGLVPTMGALHAGHLALIARAGDLCDNVVVTIFVNPTQFGPGEDLEAYPRSLEADRAKCEAAGVTIVFAPQVAAVYPPGAQTTVQPGSIATRLCGASRPGHFAGVCTVVAKLFNMVGPCRAVFGEKDYQQVQVIKRMTTDLNLPVEIVTHPTIREDDGLAMSSRNAYLSKEERKAAPEIYAALSEVRSAVAQGLREIEQARAQIKARISSQRCLRLDYLEICQADTLEPIATLGEGPGVIAVAVFAGTTRLIDNVVVG